MKRYRGFNIHRSSDKQWRDDVFEVEGFFDEYFPTITLAKAAIDQYISYEDKNMLIEAPVKPNDVVTLKMVGGDEVVGKLINESMDTYIELSKPLVVMMAQQGFGLAPYILTAGPDASAKLDRKHVIAIVKTLEAVAKQYIKQTSNIVIP